MDAGCNLRNMESDPAVCFITIKNRNHGVQKMKYLRSLAAGFLAVMLLGGAVAVNAAEPGFSTETLSRQDEDRIRSNVEIVPLEAPPRKSAIQCFDVNREGMLAVGTGNGERKTIAVYDPDGMYQYGFTYRVSGDFGLQWEGENIVIYSVRGDLAFIVNPHGELEEIQEIQNTPENNAYWHHVVFAKERRAGDCLYRLENHMGVLNLFASSYSQLVCVHSDGSKQVLYDVSAEQLTKAVFVMLLIILFAAIVLCAIWKQFRKMNPGKPIEN